MFDPASISIIVSVIALIAIVAVSVYLINKSYDDEVKRQRELKNIVSQVNTAQESAVEVDNKQNLAIGTTNDNFTRLQSDVTEVKTDYVSKTDVAKEVISTKGQFDTLEIGKSAVMGINGTGGLDIKMNGNTVIGFDGTTKKMLVGAELSLNGPDGVLKTDTDQGRLILRNGAGPSGLIVKQNKVGIGADPTNGLLDVRGTIWGEQIIANSAQISRANIGGSNNSWTLLPDGTSTDLQIIPGNVESPDALKQVVSISSSGELKTKGNMTSSGSVTGISVCLMNSNNSPLCMKPEDLKFVQDMKSLYDIFSASGGSATIPDSSTYTNISDPNTITYSPTTAPLPLA